MDIERRRYVRFLLRSTTYVALGHNFDKVGKVKDISTGGFAFQYISDIDHTDGLTQAYIFLLDQDMHLSGVPCSVVYDHEVTKHDSLLQFGRPLVTIRCGVRFGILEKKHIAQLEHLINKHTSGHLP